MQALRAAPMLLLAATAPAQDIVPSAVATTKPPGFMPYSPFLFYSSTTTTAQRSRSQSIYDLNDFTVPAAFWSSLAVRRPHGIGNVNPACSANALIVISNSVNAHSAASTAFAANTGLLPTTVLNGPISLPNHADPPAWPAPWVPIPFTTDFLFVKGLGASLVVDIYYTGTTATLPWYVEYSIVDTGVRGENGGYMPSCKFSTGNASNSLSYQSPFIGSTWYVRYDNLVANAPGFGAIGTKGIGQAWGSILLPIDLTPLNAPGCQWTCSADFTIPMLTNATRSASWSPPGIPIPNAPSLIGVKFYDQAAFLDAPANGLGFVPTWPSAWTIGSNIGPPGTTVYAAGASAGGAMGIREVGAVQSMQFN